jgi:hypothetical protein
MANIIGLITINGKEVLEVDAIPSTGLGTVAPVGSSAMFDDGLNLVGSGKNYIKVGPSDVDWDMVMTTTLGGVGEGNYLRLPIYDTNATGFHLDDTVNQNGFAMDVALEAQPARSVAIEYRIPNPGNGISTADFILSEGAQTKNGNMTFLNSTQTQIKDKILTLNQGGGAGSAGGSGLEFAEAVQAISTSTGANAGSVFTATATGSAGNGIIVTVVNGAPGPVTVVEGPGTVLIDLALNAPVSQATLAAAGLTLVTLNGVGLIAPEVFPATAGGSGTITGYLRMSADRLGYDLLPSATGFVEKLSSANLTASRTAKFADTSGTFVMRADGTPGVATQIAFWTDADNIAPATGFTFSGGVVTIPSMVISNLGLGVVHSSAGGVLSSSAVVLTSEVSGILPIANGGTNSATALVNDRLMYSLGGSIVEYSAMVANQVYFGAAGTGLPAQSINLFWDIVNSRLGIGNAAPTRVLDVTGSSLFGGAVKIATSTLTKANLEWIQAELIGATGNSYQTLATLTIPTDSVVLVEVRVLARRTGGSAGTVGDSADYVRTCRFKNVAGVTTQYNLQTDHTSEDQSFWDATITSAGLIQVRGQTNNTINWTVTYAVQVLN